MSFLVDDQLRNMDHLDLAGFISMPSSNWQIPAFETSSFEQQDAIYLASSRQMLEPIMEETSEDEESNHNSWTQYENHSVWSSESETGSVIRIEVNRDPDSISERDFACPAKRARRDEFIIGGLLTCQPLIDDSNSLRKYQRHDLLSTAIDQIKLNESNSLTNTLSTGSTGQRKRFDEFYCDMDSVSCNSLSRSSSLIQFESLERQLLNEQGLCSSLGNSSPSLLSFEGGCIDGGSGSGSNSNRGSTGSLKRYESSSGRLHQTYFDLDKIDFAENLHFTSTAASKSDSESSSDNSVASHKIVNTNGATHARNFLKAGKNSAENLSEDSGYCEYIHSVLRAKSKSIPSFEKFCEEDEFYDHSMPVAVAVAHGSELRKSHSKIQATTVDEAPKIDRPNVIGNGSLAAAGAITATEAKQPTTSAVTEEDDADDDNDEEEEQNGEEEEIDGDGDGDGDCWYTGDKNSRRSPSSSSPISSDESSATSTNTSATSSSCASASSFTWRPAPAPVPALLATSTSAPAAKIESTIPKAPLHRSPNRSSSLPDILAEEAPFALSPAVGRDSPERYQRENHYYYHQQQPDSLVFQSDNTEQVTSVPSDLDRLDDHHQSTYYPTYPQACSTHPQRHRRSSAHRRLPLLRRTLSASSSSDLDEDQSEQSSVVARSNSWKRTRRSTSAERLESSSQSVRSLHSIGSGSGIGYINASYNNLTLLDYSGRPRSNRNSLSLVDDENRANSKRNSREMGDIVDETESSPSDSKTEEDKEDTEEDIQHVQLTIRKPPRRNSSKSKSNNKTFDQDPTSLKTSYAQSLEKCNFDPKELSNLDLTRISPKRRFHSSSAAKKRAGMVSSTPNLNTFNREEAEDDMFVSSAHTSMNQLPITEKRLGILLPAGSRTSFGKGVSFCPVVSKYMWQEQSSEECADALTADEPPADATVVDIEETTSKESEPREMENVSDDCDSKSDDVKSNSEKTSPTEENTIKEKITITISSVVAAAPTNSMASSPPNSTKVPAVERGSDCYTIKAVAPTQASTQPPIQPTSIANNNVSVKPYVAVIDHSPRSIRRASNRHLDNPRPATPVPQILVYPPSVAASGSVNPAKMSNYAVKCSAASGDSHSLNNNNELVKSKFKADEKHPQHKSFLSRFANGFRFSLRRNKKKKQKEIQDAQEKQGQLPPIPPPSRKTATQNSPDFIYIPLKGSSNQSSKSSKSPSSTFYYSAGNGTAPCNNGKSSPSPSAGSNHVLNVKQQSAAIQKPPRVVGVCEKRAESAGQHALQQSGAPQSIDAEFLDNERSYYDFENQLNGVTNGNGCNTEHDTGLTMNTSSSQHQIPRADPNKMYCYNHQHQPQMQQQQQQQQQQQLNHCKIGLIETNLDTHETKISGKTRSLMELGPQLKYNFTSKRNTSGYDVDGGGGGGRGGVGYGDDDDGIDDDDDVDGSGCDGEDSGVVGVKKSGVKSGGVGGSAAAAVAAARRPHKSMEFLLDKENQKNVLPPENELQKSHDNTTRLSEHQLRVQASLQRLNIPDWFRQYNNCLPKSPDVLGYKPGNTNFTRKRTSDSGRWTGLNSKTTSLSSLGSQRSDRSPLLLSPSAHSHHGGQTSIGSVIGSTGAPNVSGGFSRWSTSYLNSTQTSPSVSTRGSFSRGGPVNSSFISATSSTAGARSSFRQPYLGWRSQEKLSQPRTPHERLASSLLAQRSPKPEPVTPEIQTSIKEVTSAIVHYVNDQTNRNTQRSRSASPNSRKCWLESSFVGIRPMESPQTPIIDNSTFSNTSTGGLNHSFHNNTTSATSSIHSSIGLPHITTTDGIRINGVGGESAILI